MLPITMNLTHLEHAGIALVLQFVLAMLTGDWWLGAAFASALFIGREHAQAEYRYIETHGRSRYATPKPAELGAFLASSWTRDSLLDWITPTVTVVVVAYLMRGL